LKYECIAKVIRNKLVCTIVKTKVSNFLILCRFGKRIIFKDAQKRIDKRSLLPKQIIGCEIFRRIYGKIEDKENKRISIFYEWQIFPMPNLHRTFHHIHVNLNQSFEEKERKNLARTYQKYLLGEKFYISLNKRFFFVSFQD
jgi:hypothetical protein